MDDKALKELRASPMPISMENEPMTHTFKLHLYQFKPDYADEPQWVITTSEGVGKERAEWLYIGTREFACEVPGFQDMRAHQITALTGLEKSVRAEFANRITEIHARINKLQALEMSA